jgi:hypothetical protein
MDSEPCRVAVLLRIISERYAVFPNLEYLGKLVACSDHGPPRHDETVVSAEYVLPRSVCAVSILLHQNSPFCEAVPAATHDWIVAARDACAYYMFLLGSQRMSIESNLGKKANGRSSFGMSVCTTSLVPDQRGINEPIGWKSVAAPAGREQRSGWERSGKKRARSSAGPQTCNR